MTKVSSTADAFCSRASIIRDHWSAEQAFAVFELLDELRERLWEIYGLQIQTLLRDQRTTCSTREDPQDSNPDDPPF